MGEEGFFGPHGEPDRYQLRDAVATDGDAVVWRAVRQSPDGGAEFAVKVISGERTAQGGGTPENYFDLMKGHVARLRAITHVGLARVEEVFLGDKPHEARQGTPIFANAYFVVEWNDGIPFSEWCKSEPDWTMRLQALTSVAQVLDIMHSADPPLVHGNVKPDKILVKQNTEPGGQPKSPMASLVGYGMVGRSPTSTTGQTPVSDGYVAPEIIRGDDCTPSSELYALAGVVYYAITLEEPSRHELNFTRVERLYASGLSEVAVTAIMTAFQGDPENRTNSGCSTLLDEVLLSTLRPARRLSRLEPGPAGSPPLLRRLLNKWFVAFVGLIVLGIAWVAINNGFLSSIEGTQDGRSDSFTPKKPSKSRQVVTPSASLSPSQTSSPSVTVSPDPSDSSDPGLQAAIDGVGLETMEPVRSQYWFSVEDAWGYEDGISINGHYYLHGLVSGVMGECISDHRGDEQSATWTLARRYKSLKGELGVEDLSSSDRPVRVVLTSETGAVLLDTTVRAGKSTNLNLDVSGIYRLTIVATQSPPDARHCTTVAIGDPVLR